MTARKPADFRVYRTVRAKVFQEGEIVISAESIRGAAPGLSPREARALAHWLTLAAEYAESLERPPAPASPFDPREIDRVFDRMPFPSASTKWDQVPPPDPFEGDALDEFVEAQLRGTGALK